MRKVSIVTLADLSVGDSFQFAYHHVMDRRGEKARELIPSWTVVDVQPDSCEVDLKPGLGNQEVLPTAKLARLPKATLVAIEQACG